MALESRFQTTCCIRAASHDAALAAGSSSVRSVMSFACAAERTTSIPSRMTVAQLAGTDLQAQLAGNDARHVQHVVDELHHRPGIAIDDVEALVQLRVAAPALRAASQDVHPADDRAQGRAHLVRERGQEHILGEIGLVGPFVRFAAAR